jgi:hypothetical protein
MFVTVLAVPVNHEHRDGNVFPDQKVCVMRTSRRVSSYAIVQQDGDLFTATRKVPSLQTVSVVIWYETRQ